MSEPEKPVTIAISSTLLFERKSMTPGPVFSFVKALKAVNDRIQEYFPETVELFKVILIKENSSERSLNKTINNHELSSIVSGEHLIAGEQLIADLQRNKTHLYLSATPGFRIQEAVNGGIAAAIVFAPENIPQESEIPLRVAFDGDAVLFSDESERVNSTGLENFFKHEDENVDVPMTEGPFKVFLEALRKMQQKFYDTGKRSECPIRTYLLTARGAGNPGYRALNTMKTWGLATDEAYFLSGSSKGPLIEVINPHIFFDDQENHLKEARRRGKLAFLVPHSIP